MSTLLIQDDLSQSYLLLWLGSGLAAEKLHRVFSLEGGSEKMATTLER